MTLSRVFEKPPDTAVDHRLALAFGPHIVPGIGAILFGMAHGKRASAHAGVIAEIALHQAPVGAIAVRWQADFRAQNLHGRASAMQRAGKIFEFFDAIGGFAQQAAICARLLPTGLGQRRVVMTGSPTLDIVLALAMANDIKREGAKVGHRSQVLSRRFTLRPRTRKTTPCGSSRSDISFAVSPSNKPRRIRVKPPCATANVSFLMVPNQSSARSATSA